MNNVKSTIGWCDKIECACGCGAQIPSHDQWGRPHRFVSGHNSWGNKHGVNKKHTEEWKNQMSKRRMGAGNSQFKTGKVLDDKGYVLVLCPEHPFKKHRNYVYEHRLVMEQHLGRYLYPEESVHHLNGIKSDNRLENLKLFSSDSAHAIFEGRGKHNDGKALVRYTKSIKKPRFEITCACGCGTIIVTPDKQARPRRFANGHSQRGRHWKWTNE